MSESEHTLSVVRRVFAAFAAHDLDAFRDLLHPDILLHVGGGPTTIAGIDAVVAAVSVTLRAIPDLRVTVVSAFADGPLAAAEVVSNVSKTFQSPVLDVADRVVDGVPQSVKRLAIEWFGTNDKRALLIGITSLLVVYAAVVGVVVLGRRWIAAIVGITAFGLAGAYASQTAKRPYLRESLLRATAEYWGRFAQYGTAEALEVVRESS